MKPIVEAEHLAKVYRLGSIGATSLRESMEGLLGRRKKKVVADAQRASRMGEQPNEFWALRDVSFSVPQGGVVGIVGRNGAGKSTLLKILSRITEPTSGRAVLRGRVASLLEVGTGFHPELSGRENIFLNGAILGMRRREIAAKFEEIVEFSEIGAFIDTPVKRYSSGMFVRLAFAVAAHLEPEILLIDEVLAVGDAAFQKKCLGKMGEVAHGHGRTVFYVSHNMGAVRQLCDTAILIDGGRVVADGSPAEVVSRYFTLTLPTDAHAGQIAWTPEKAPRSEWMQLHAIRLRNEHGECVNTFESDRPFAIEVEYEMRQKLHGVRLELALLTQDGEMAFRATDHIYQPETAHVGRYRSTCHIPGGLLNRRNYIVALHSTVPGERMVLPPAEYITFSVAGVGNQASTFPENWPGVVCPKIAWSVESLGEPAAPAPEEGAA